MKIILKVIYPIFFLFSLIIPRRRKLWVFGCYNGYTNNTRYFFEYVSNLKEIECVWLANNKEEFLEVQNLGYKSVIKNSIKGFSISSQAGFTFICTGFSDVNRLLSFGSKVINFWHGTPIKKVYLDSLHDLNRLGTNKLSVFVSTKLMTFLTSRIAFYYASNELEREIVCKAAKIPLSKSLALGAPRYDKIRELNISKLQKLIDLNKKIFLFAPTWREKANWSNKYYVTNEIIKKLNLVLTNQNAILLIKPHPLTKSEELLNLNLISSDFIRYTSEFGIDDINDIYPIADLLITDVSSSIFDFQIFNKPIYLFMPDKDEYLSGDRGIYEYFIKVLNQHSIMSWTDLIYTFDNSNPPSFFKDMNFNIQNIVTTNQNIYNDIQTRFL